jgi:hypothetical protein
MPLCGPKSMASTFHFAFVLAMFTSHAVGVNNGLARTPQMGWVSKLSGTVRIILLSDMTRTTGMPLVAMFLNRSSSTRRRSLSTLACGMSDILMWC